MNITVINPISAQMYEAYETLDYRFKTKNPKAVLFSDKGLWIREAIDENRFLVLQAKSLRQEGKTCCCEMSTYWKWIVIHRF